MPVAFALTLLTAITLSSAAAQAQPDNRLTDALDEIEMKYDVLPSGQVRINIQADADRFTVAIRSDTQTNEGLESRMVFAFISLDQEQITPAMMRELLEENLKTKSGAWAISDAGDGQVRLVFKAHIPADATGEQLHGTVHYTAAMVKRRAEMIRAEAKPE